MIFYPPKSLRNSAIFFIPSDTTSMNSLFSQSCCICCCTSLLMVENFPFLSVEFLDWGRRQSPSIYSAEPYFCYWHMRKSTSAPDLSLSMAVWRPSSDHWRLYANVFLHSKSWRIEEVSVINIRIAFFVNDRSSTLIPEPFRKGISNLSSGYASFHTGTSLKFFFFLNTLWS